MYNVHTWSKNSQILWLNETENVNLNHKRLINKWTKTWQRVKFETMSFMCSIFIILAHFSTFRSPEGLSKKQIFKRQMGRPVWFQIQSCNEDTYKQGYYTQDQQGINQVLKISRRQNYYFSLCFGSRQKNKTKHSTDKPDFFTSHFQNSLL